MNKILTKTLFYLFKPGVKLSQAASESISRVDRRAVMNFANSNGVETNNKFENAFVGSISDPKLLEIAINQKILEFDDVIAIYNETLKQKKAEGEDAVLSFIGQLAGVSNEVSREKNMAQFLSQLPETFMQFVPQDKAENIRWIVAIINILNRMDIRDLDIKAGTYERLSNRLDELLKNYNMKYRGEGEKELTREQLLAGAEEPESPNAAASSPGASMVKAF